MIISLLWHSNNKSECQNVQDRGAYFDIDMHRMIHIFHCLWLPLHPKLENNSFVILIGGCSTIVAMLDKMTG